MRSKIKKTVLCALMLLLSLPALAQEQKESVYERIMRTGTIRCGYFTFPPLSVKNTETKAMSGLAIDIFNKMAANMNLKVEWTEEVGFDALIPGLQTNRYDAVCTPMWPTAARAREVEFSQPFFFAVLGVWVRADETRFTKLEDINDPAITITGVDGQIEQTVHDEQFPKAKMLALPGGTDFSQQMLNVVTGKADVTFVDLIAGAQFEANNPGWLKNIAADHPLRIFPFSIAVRGGETRLKNMLDQAVLELHHTGYIERKLASYDPQHYLLPVAKSHGERK